MFETGRQPRFCLASRAGMQKLDDAIIAGSPVRLQRFGTGYQC